jgi:beta-galactosidase
LDKPATLTAELRDGDRVLKSALTGVTAQSEYHEVTIEDLAGIELWDLSHPKLYEVTALLDNGDAFRMRIGFREARFTSAGFFLNGQRVKLRGLNRHQTFPYTGGAMPARVQAIVLRKKLKCNFVRTSHYPNRS